MLASQPKARATKLAHLAAVYRQAGETGATDWEASQRLTELCGGPVPVQSVTSLRNSLMEDGVVGKGGQRMGHYGKVVTVFHWIGAK